MTPALAQSDTAFEQQTSNLVNNCRAAHDPALAHPMQGLHVELLVGLDRHKAHRGPAHCLSNRFSVDVIALVGLHERLHILRRHQAYFMALFSQCPAKEMSSSTGFHADQLRGKVRGEAE